MASEDHSHAHSHAHAHGRAAGEPPVLQTGRVITMWSGAAGGVPSSRRVMLWWTPAADSALGTLQYSEAEGDGEPSKVLVEGQSLPVGDVSDVFAGKMHPFFTAPALSALPADRCFTLDSREHAALHFQADTAEARTVILKSLRNLFVQRGENTVVEENRVASATVPARAAAAAASSDEVSNFFLDGKMFQSVTPQGIVPMFVFLDPSAGRLGALYWNETKGDKTKSEERKLLVQQISDVFVGPQAAEFQPHVAAVDRSCCFSLVRRAESGFSLHLIADDVTMRSTALAAVRQLFASKAIREVNTTNTTLPVTSVLVPHMFNRVVASPAGGFVLERIFLWHEPTLGGKNGSLCISDAEGDFTVGGPERQFAIDRIRDVMIGKQRDELKSACAADFASNRCFSFLSAAMQLHLIAESPEVRTSTIDGLKLILTGRGVVPTAGVPAA